MKVARIPSGERKSLTNLGMLQFDRENDFRGFLHFSDQKFKADGFLANCGDNGELF